MIDFRGKLDALETISFLCIRNEIDRFLVSISDPYNSDKTLDIYLSPEKSASIKVDTSSNSPYIKVKLKFSGRIDSMSSNANYLSPEVLDYISSACNNYLEANFSDFLYRTSKDLKVDICGFGRYATSNFFTSSQFDDYNWLDNYKNAFFKVEVDTSIKSAMLITET